MRGSLGHAKGFHILLRKWRGRCRAARSTTDTRPEGRSYRCPRLGL